MDPQGHFTQDIPIPLPEKQKVAQLRIGLITTCWNEELLQPLIVNTRKHLVEMGINPRRIAEPVVVPGSFELPYAAQALAKSGDVDGVICFGLLIKGETAHFEYISSATATGMLIQQLK